MDLWTSESNTQIEALESLLHQQRTQLTHLKEAAKTCKIDEECSKTELDEWIDILKSLETALSYTITELSSLTSANKDGNLLNDNKDKKDSLVDEIMQANAYFHTDAKTVVKVEVYEGKTERNLGAILLEEFSMETTNKRIKLEPNTMGIVKLHIDSSITLYKKEKTNGGTQAGVSVLNSATDLLNSATSIITPIPKALGLIGEVDDLDTPSNDYSYDKTDHSSLKGQINVKYVVDEMGEVQMEILDEIIDNKEGKECKSTLSRFVDTSNLGVVKLKGEVLSTGKYKSSESFEYAVEAYSYPSEKKDTVEIEFSEENITAISSVCEVYFEIDKHQLDSKELKKLKQWIIALSKDDGWKVVLMEKRAHIELVGYASPPASEEYNERLGKKRADFVWNSMKNQIGHEVDSKTSSISGSIKSYGEYDEENQQQKVIITITEK